LRLFRFKPAQMAAAPFKAYKGVLARALLTGLVFIAAALVTDGAAAQGHRPPGGLNAAEEKASPEQAYDGTAIGIGRIKYGGGGDWYGDPSSLPNLLREFSRRTGISTAPSDKTVDLREGGLSQYPFLYMTGHGNIKLSSGELSVLRQHLLQGGFLYADDNYGMDKSFRRMIRDLFPERRLVTVPLDHKIYHCFYDMDGPPKIHKHDGKPPEGLGVFDGKRLMVFYTYESDVGDGLEDPDVHGDPPEKREMAVRMAVNVLYYALTN
jgi:hypothetical protein